LGLDHARNHDRENDRFHDRDWHREDSRVQIWLCPALSMAVLMTLPSTST
jgi:hypothetical protein